MANFLDLPHNGRFLALERVQDPGNVGALIRSAAAFGFDGVILSPGCADPFGPKVLRASMGAAGRMPVVTCPNLADALAQLRAWAAPALRPRCTTAARCMRWMALTLTGCAWSSAARGRAFPTG